MSLSTPIEYAGELERMMRGYQSGAVLIAFAQLGVGDALASGALSPEEVAERTGTDSAAMARFLPAAESLGFVSSEDGRYRLTNLSRHVLASDGKASIVHLLVREATFYLRWSRLAEAVRIGGRPEANARDEQHPEWVPIFVMALADTARMSEPGITATLAPIIGGLDRPARVIDVGGCHGIYSLGLARRFPSLSAVVFDLPPVIAVTRRIIAEMRFADRVMAIAGDFRVDSLGSGYDLALTFGVLVGENAEQSVALLRKVHDALLPGGHIAIRTGGRGKRGDGPALNSAMADVHMLLSTRGGAAHSADHTREWLQEVGFTDLDELDVPSPGHGALLVARKPLEPH